MIDTITQLFRQQAREHKALQSFIYARNYDKGSGKDTYPLFWLEDPIGGSINSNVFDNNLSFCILLLNETNDISRLQSIAFSIGLNIIERIKKHHKDTINITTWNYTTLRHYYDDDAVGCRFSIRFNTLNIQNLCLIDEQFDENKSFAKANNMPTFDLQTTNACEHYSDLLPVFDLKLKKDE